MTRRTHDFQTIRSEGGLLPPDLLRRVIDPKAKLDGTTPQDYGLPPGERLNEAITQSWNRLRKHWADFRASAKNLPVEEAGTGLTNDKWSVPLLRELGFGLLPTSAAPEIGGKTYAINRFFGATAIHLIGCGLSLDRRAKGVRGAAIANPHGLVQDFLNRSDKQLWAILSNGLHLRILRDSQAISRQSYLEFDLEAMFDGEVFADFVLLWLMAHSTRFAVREGGRPETCRLEQWTKFAEEQGMRALGDLKQGVEKALEILGQGFVSHPKNTALRDALRTGKVSGADLHGQLLRVVYRLIFLFVAEDRTLEGLPVLHAPDDGDAARIARERYAEHYSAGRLREMAGAIRGSRHGDLWWQLNLVVGALSGEERFKAVREQLALPVLGSFLWSPDSTAALNAPSVAQDGGAELANADLLEAIRNLAFTRQNRSLRPVDYKNLGAEELGGVYESLLALTPQISSDGAKFTFAEFAGNERKTSGSYYTPDSLVQCLLDSALDPVVEEAIKGKNGAEAEKAILALKVCDPAVGSGHFLVGAAHRLALHLARIRATAQGEGEPSPGFYQHALRDVIGRCLYGVDINPMAAELCRVSLWVEALDPGKPLSFLDHHIRVGNSLLGTTPELIDGGLPDDAFTAIEGDDKKVCAQLKTRNKAEREGFEQRDLLGGLEHGVAADLSTVTQQAAKLDATADDTVEAVRRKADQFRRLVVSPEYKHAQQVADAWCAAFVWPKTTTTLTDVVTTSAIKRLGTDPQTLTAAQAKEVEMLSGQYQFFHWHLAFPEVFAKGGFDCVLGNPPWERFKVSDTEFFAYKQPQIASIQNAARRQAAISNLATQDPALFAEWTDHLRKAAGAAHFARSAGRFVLSAVGELNSHGLFIETGRQLLGWQARQGFIVPSGLATDKTYSLFFQDLVRTSSLVSLYDFENREGFFPNVDSRYRFCILTLRRPVDEHMEAARFVFQATRIDDLKDERKQFSLTEDDFRLLNPNTGGCPIFANTYEAEITKHIYRRFSVLSSDQSALVGWQPRVAFVFEMNKNADLFVDAGTIGDRNQKPAHELVDREGKTWIALYEAKQIHQFDHRYASYNLRSAGGEWEAVTEKEHKDANFCVAPRQYVLRSDFVDSLQRRGIDGGWFLTYRDITNATNERSAIFSALPYVPMGNTWVLCLDGTDRSQWASFLACMNSFASDFIARRKIGGSHLNFYILRQLAVPSPASFQGGAGWLGAEHIGEWLLPRVLELTYTAWDLEPFAKDCGFDGPPFHWDEDRRFLLRAERDAAFFHLYLPADANGNWIPARKTNGCPYDETPEQVEQLTKSFPKPRDAVSYIMDTFPIVKRKDEAVHGLYRTKEAILQIYDEMQDAIRTGRAYRTKLEPPPGDSRCCHPKRAEGMR